MKRTLLMPCLAVLVLAAAVLFAAGVEAGTLAVAAVAIACPLMMLFMMGGMFGMARRRHGAGHAGHESPRDHAAAP